MTSWISGSTEAMVFPLAFKEFIISSESPSRTAPPIPISCPNSNARAVASASTSIGWYAGEMLWTREAITELVWSRITTPIPHLFSFLKIAPSKFILKWPALGGFQISLVLVVLGGFGGSTARNSLSLSFTWVAIWSKAQQGLWRRTWFRWFHISHVVIAKSSGWPWLLRIHDSNSLKFVGFIYFQPLNYILSLLCMPNFILIKCLYCWVYTCE